MLNRFYARGEFFFFSAARYQTGDSHLEPHGHSFCMGHFSQLLRFEYGCIYGGEPLLGGSVVCLESSGGGSCCLVSASFFNKTSWPYYICTPYTLAHSRTHTHTIDTHTHPILISRSVSARFLPFIFSYFILLFLGLGLVSGFSQLFPTILPSRYLFSLHAFSATSAQQCATEREPELKLKLTRIRIRIGYIFVE